MIDFAPILKIIPIFAVALIVPGPDFMMISSVALSRGRLAGFLASCGIAAGNVTYTILSLFGLSIIFMHMHWLVMIVRVCGACYLLYLGFLLWKSSLKAPTVQSNVVDPLQRRNKNPFIVGLLTNLTNPKAMAFFTSIFTLILPAEASHETYAATIVLIAVMSVLWFGFVTLGLSTPAMRRHYLRWSRWIDRVAGSFLGLFGLGLLFSGRD
jgi:threonine efflux protein